MASWKALRGESSVGANDGETEAEFRQFMSYLFAQASTGKATTGVLTGYTLAATTPSPSGSVVVGSGLAVCQSTTTGGVTPIPNTSGNLDIFTANPMQFESNPRNDIVVADSTDGQVKALIGTPNATPSLGEQAVPATAVALWRIRHAAGATTIPGTNFDDLRVKTSLFGAKPENKRSGWGVFTGNLGSSGAINFNHNQPFTPTVVLPNDPEADASTADIAWKIGIGSISSTVVQFVCYKYDGTYLPTGTNVTIHAFFGE